MTHGEKPIINDDMENVQLDCQYTTIPIGRFFSPTKFSVYIIIDRCESRHCL